MKNLKLFLVAVAMIMTTAVSAQSFSTAWNGVRVAYNAFSIENSDCTGIEAGYAHAFTLSESMPLFLEVGGNVFWATDTDFSMWSLTVPVSVGYKFDLNEEWSLVPYAGVNVRANILGEADDIDIFDEDEMQGYEWKRFQFGAHVGVTANYKNYSIGAKYGFDFNEIAEEAKCSTIAIALGYNF